MLFMHFYGFIPFPAGQFYIVLHELREQGQHSLTRRVCSTMDQGLEQRLRELGYDTEHATDISAVKACKSIASIFGKDEHIFRPGMVLFTGYTRAVVSKGGEQYVLETDCLAVTNGTGGLLLTCLDGKGESVWIEGEDEKGMYLPSIDSASYFYDRVMMDFVRLARGDRKSNTIARIDIMWDRETGLHYLPNL